METTMIILDLEATCWGRNNKHLGNKTLKNKIGNQEIIEIGALKIDPDLNTAIDSFQCIVKPKLNPELSTFCKDLTGITQSDISNAESFDRVFAKLSLWASTETSFASWGSFDRNLLKLEFDRNNIESPTWFKWHHNIKKVYSNICNPAHKKSTLRSAINHLNLEFVGTPHSAYADCVNAWKVYKTLMDMM